MPNQYTNRPWTEEDTNFLIERLEEVKEDRGLTIKEMHQQHGVATKIEIQRRLEAIALGQGIRLLGVWSKDGNTPIKIRKPSLHMAKKNREKVTRSKFMCLCVINNNRMWLSFSAVNRESAVRGISVDYPTIQTILGVCTIKEYSKIRASTGRQLSSPSMISSSKVARAGRTRKVE